MDGCFFDEVHLGTQEQEGVMALAQKFRLEGYLYGMLGVVVLFLWRNSVPLVPLKPQVAYHRWRRCLGKRFTQRVGQSASPQYSGRGNTEGLLCGVEERRNARAQTSPSQNGGDGICAFHCRNNPRRPDCPVVPSAPRN